MKKKYKVMCVGDSTSLPGHDNSYEDTWFYRLTREFINFDFINVFRRGITTEILVTEGGGYDQFPMGADCLEFYDPNMVILNLGIVDCAPRLLNRVDNLILRCLPNIAKRFFIKGIKKIKTRKASNTLVSQQQFEYNLINYIERCLLKKVEMLILISIPVPDERMVKKNPNIIKNVEEFNKILCNMAEKYFFIKSISPLDSRNYDKVIFEDGYHPNPLGNDIVFQELKEVINDNINK